MSDLSEKHLTYLKLRKELLAETKSTMDIELILIIFVVALMVLVILGFVCFLIVSRCQKRRKDQYSNWIRTGSIEHLRFTPAEREAHRMRTSTPVHMELPTYEDFIGSQHNNYLGLFYSPYSNPLNLDNPMQITESAKSQNLFQTFTNKNEPKYIYWETRV